MERLSSTVNSKNDMDSLSRKEVMSSYIRTRKIINQCVIKAASKKFDFSALNPRKLEDDNSEGSDEVEEEEDGEAENEKEEEQTENNRRLSLILTDTDVLDCSICFKDLIIPVYQCVNGHIACGGCCLVMNNKCRSCSCPIGYNRCMAIEKVLGAVHQVSCRNLKYGCTHMMKYSGNRTHESMCKYSPCSCPMEDSCNFVDTASNLYKHIHTNHSTTTFRFNNRFTLLFNIIKSFLFLREETLGIIFALDNFVENAVRFLSVVLISPESHKGKYRYELEAKDGGETSLILQSHVVSVPKLANNLLTKFLMLDEGYVKPSGTIELDICISQH